MENKNLSDEITTDIIDFFGTQMPNLYPDESLDDFMKDKASMVTRYCSRVKQIWGRVDLGLIKDLLRAEAEGIEDQFAEKARKHWLIIDEFQRLEENQKIRSYVDAKLEIFELKMKSR